MHNHYLPQYYLKGFCSNANGDIWVYDKKEARVFSANVIRIANICGFYSEEIEKYLTEDIESTANRVLDKIRNRERVDANDKMALSRYISVMWKRVPEAKNRVKRRAPELGVEVQEKLHRTLDQIAEKDPSKKDLAQTRKVEAEEILRKLSQDIPPEVWHRTIPAENTPKMVGGIATMTWRFLTFDEKPAFITCDNPVFFFPQFGIGRAESELSFPISSSVMLWATRRTDLPEGYFPTKMIIVKEMTRRIASVTTRYTFHSKKEDWILKFLAKGHWRLNRIQ